MKATENSTPPKKLQGTTFNGKNIERKVQLNDEQKEVAAQRLKHITDTKIKNTLQGDKQRDLSYKKETLWEQSRKVLLPCYKMQYTYNNQDYNVSSSALNHDYIHNGPKSNNAEQVKAQYKFFYILVMVFAAILVMSFIAIGVVLNNENLEHLVSVFAGVFWIAVAAILGLLLARYVLVQNKLITLKDESRKNKLDALKKLYPDTEFNVSDDMIKDIIKQVKIKREKEEAKYTHKRELIIK